MNAHTDADPARFPPPSTIAGCLRTAWARTTDQPFGSELAKLDISGPLLIDGADKVLVPKPADARYFGHGDDAACVRAEPQCFDAGCGADLPETLLPVQLTRQIDGKPSDGPAWWSWNDLLAFRSGKDIPIKQLRQNGWSSPVGDRRTHVSINPATGATVTGALYETEGLDLGSPLPNEGRAMGDLRLLARCAERMEATLVHLGGKRRLAALEPEPETHWPAPSDEWLTRICEARGLCVTLLTPAIFAKGYRPGWLDETLTGSPPDVPELTLRLRAVATARWQPHSGWDLANRRPKPTRKLVPAGAAYWFEVLGGCEPAAVRRLWLASVSDAQQDRRDGFGLALPGPWTPPTDPDAGS